MCEADTPAPTPEPADEAPQAKATITYDDFCKLDLRVATIVEVAEHPNADKLLVLQIDLGGERRQGERRQIIAGIKAAYAPESLLGKQIVVVANLQPRKMRGMESNGMLLAASAGESPDDVVVLTLDRDVPPGSSVS